MRLAPSIIVTVAALAGCGRVGFVASDREGVDAGSDASAPTDTAVEQELQLWFTFDGSMMTNGGMSQGAISCAPACPTVVPGKRGSAAGFDGSTTALRIADRPELHVSAGTIAMWMRPTALPPMGLAHSLAGAAYGGASLNSWEVYFYAGAAGMTLYTGGDGGGGPQAALLWDRGIDAWFHVAATWDGVTRQRMYIDGVEVASDTQFPLVYDDHDVIIGADETNFGIQNRFVGDLDEVRFYSRELSAAEIAQLAAP